MLRMNLIGLLHEALLGESVDNSGQQQFVKAMDNFMNSGSKNMPYTVTLSEISFTNGDFDSTHQLCFIGQSADAFCKWGLQVHLQLFKDALFC